MDSGLGRTLSSYVRSKIRSRSEERITPMMPATSLRSEAWSEPVAKIHSNHKTKYANYRPKDDSVLMSIPLPRSKIFLNNEQYSHHKKHDNFEKQIITEKHKAKREKNMGSYSEERTENSTKLQVPPLNSNRLEPTRHRTKKVILTLLDDGEVCIEFTQKHRNNTVRRKR